MAACEDDRVVRDPGSDDGSGTTQPTVNPQCGEECTLNEWACETDSQYRICGLNSENCLVWGPVRECGTGNVCNADSSACVSKGSTEEPVELVSCENACGIMETKCEDGFLVRCEEDANGCQVWGKPESCDANEVCQGDACVPQSCSNQCDKIGTTKCENHLLYTCTQDEEEDGCLKWDDGVTCEVGKRCDESENACVEGCVDECNPEGRVACYGGGTRTCGQFDEDSCLEWGNFEECNVTLGCDEETGQCAVATCSDECGDGESTCNDDATGTLICVKNASTGCYVWKQGETCTGKTSCVKDVDTAKCETPVVNICDAGDKHCTSDNKGIENCTLIDGAYGWKTTACSGNQVCDDSTVTCKATCTNACTLNALQCTTTGVPQKCTKNTSTGCTVWTNQTECGVGKSCKDGACVDSCSKDCTPFQLVIIPDPQYYTRGDDDKNNIYYQQMNWIVKEKEKGSKGKLPNLKMVIHMGDITDYNVASQWKIAQNAQNILKEKEIPFTITTGNHDYRKGTASGDGFTVTGAGSRGNTKFSKYFGKSYLETLPGYGGIYSADGGNESNNYFTFTAGGQEYMVLSLEYAPRQQVMCWANNLLKDSDNLNKKVILVTHANLTHETKDSNNKPKKNRTGAPGPEFVPHGASGSQLWNGLTRRHSNIIMALSGHVGDTEHYLSTETNNKNTVLEILTDYQYEKPCNKDTLAECNAHCRGTTNSGNGWLRILTMDPKNGTVKSEIVSVLSGSKSTFSKKGTDQLFCSTLFDTSKDGPNKDLSDRDRQWYHKSPTNTKDHNFTITDFDFSKAQKNVYNDKGYKAFTHRDINYKSSGNQVLPSVAAHSDGHFVAVWEDDSSDADGTWKGNSKLKNNNWRGYSTNSHDIYARVFHAEGCSNGNLKEIVVNAETAGHQAEPDVAMDGNGNFVVVYTDDKDNNGSTEVRMHGFKADGSQLFSDRAVNTVSTGDQYEPRISMASDGHFAVSWTDASLGAGKEQVKVRGFKANGSELFAERALTDSQGGTQVKSDVFMDDSHRTVVVWEDDSDGNGATQVRMRLLDASGGNRTKVKAVNSVDTGNQNSPSIDGKRDGSRYIVAWQDVASKKYRIMARTFNANGNDDDTSNDDYVLSLDTSAILKFPTVCMNNSGNATVVWHNDTTKNIMRRSLKGTAVSGSSETRTNGGNYDQLKFGDDYSGSIASQPAIGCMPDANYAVTVYYDDGDGNGTGEIYGVGVSVP